MNIHHQEIVHKCVPKHLSFKNTKFIADAPETENEYNANSTQEHNQIHASKTRVLIRAQKFREAAIHHRVTKQKPFSRNQTEAVVITRADLSLSPAAAAEVLPGPSLSHLPSPSSLSASSKHTYSLPKLKAKENGKESIIFEPTKAHTRFTNNQSITLPRGTKAPFFIDSQSLKHKMAIHPILEPVFFPPQPPKL